MKEKAATVTVPAKVLQDVIWNAEIMCAAMPSYAVVCAQTSILQACLDSEKVVVAQDYACDIDWEHLAQLFDDDLTQPEQSKPANATAKVISFPRRSRR